MTMRNMLLTMLGITLVTLSATAVLVEVINIFYHFGPFRWYMLVGGSIALVPSFWFYVTSAQRYFGKVANDE